MKTIYTINETRVSIYPKGGLEPISAEEILESWTSGYFSSPDGAFDIDIDENYEDKPRMFDTLEEAKAAFARIRPASIAEEAEEKANKEDDSDIRHIFRNVSIWALEKVVYDEDGQSVDGEQLNFKADECIA